jgi:phosphate transport system permease protein
VAPLKRGATLKFTQFGFDGGSALNRSTDRVSTTTADSAGGISKRPVDTALEAKLKRAHLIDKIGKVAIVMAGSLVLLGVFMILLFLMREASELVLNPSKHTDGTLDKMFLPQKFEGYDKAQYVWQTEAGEGHQAKYSIPILIWGTMKGAIWSMIFSAPLAILTALFISEFAKPSVRDYCKAGIELLAGVPTVVVGFIAFVVLSPTMNNYYLANKEFFHGGKWAILFLQIPVFAMAASWIAARVMLNRGGGLATKVIGVIAALIGGLSFAIATGFVLSLIGGPVLNFLFGMQEYRQLNAVLAGFCLGFAIIPIVFSVAEDAMRAVPATYREASLGLGASKWETALQIVVPAALPGIYAALMLGLARAVGETMIVLMASGNTPILDSSPFTGMRTMSAAIAIEASEKAQYSTGYYVLFFVGAVLFLLTLVLNLVTEQVMYRLRKRYTVG